jgi:protein-S-isoprenylcysteine O-methyltransferase Ste14
MNTADYQGYAYTAAQWFGLVAVFWAGWHHGNPEGPAWLSVAGGVLMTASLIPAVLGFRDLGVNLSPWPHPHATNRLVTHGIYRHLRHPLYLSLIVFSLGWAAWSQSWAAFVATVFLTAVLRRKASCEERLLVRRHADYASYARTTGCFLPRWFR